MKSLHVSSRKNRSTHYFSNQSYQSLVSYSEPLLRSTSNMTRTGSKLRSLFQLGIVESKVRHGFSRMYQSIEARDRPF